MNSQFDKVHFFFNKDVIDKEKQAACEAADQGLCVLSFSYSSKRLDCSCLGSNL